MTESEAIKTIQLDICNGCECIENCITNQCEYFLAIKALEKQIPKKRNSYNCPVCSHYFEDGECFTYCPECGQRLE